MESYRGGGSEDEFLKRAGGGGGSGESPGRKKGMESWKSMVSAGNNKQLYVAEESVTLSVIDMFLCPQVPRRVSSCDMGHLPAMAGWGEMEPQLKCSRICLTRDV